jgi:hypothetical protein
MIPYWYTFGELYDRQKAHPGESYTQSLDAMALAASRKKASDNVSTNMIHARELDINAITTVSDLFELIDLPHRITKKATLSVVPWSQKGSFTTTFKLRLEWRGEPE